MPPIQRLSHLPALVALALCVSFCASAVEAPLERDAWFLMLVGGKRAGHLHESRSVEESAGRRLVKTTAESSLSITRLGTTLSVTTRASFWETPEGRPEQFESVNRFSNSDFVTRGERTEGGFRVTTSALGKESSELVEWPDDVLFPYAIERRLAELGYEPGHTIELRTFTAEQLKPTALTIAMKARESVELLGEKRELLHIELEQEVLPNIILHQWHDASGEVLRSELAVMGMPIVAVRCSRDQALVEPESVEMLVSTLIDPAAVLPHARKLDSVRYRMAPKAGSRAKLGLPQDARQSWKPLTDGAIELTVLAESWSRPAPAPEPGDSYRQASPILQSDDPLVSRMATRATSGQTSDAARARAIIDYVYREIRKKDLSVGLATAKEVARRLSGDCTEHAVLAAALARAVGIPSKIATGLVYYQGAFAYHMWIEVYVDGAWRSVDPAFGLHASDPTHIKLGESAYAQGFVDDGLVQLVSLISQIDLRVLDYTLEGKSYAPGRPSERPTGDLFRSSLYSFEVSRPAGWAFADSESTDADPAVLVALARDDGARATFKAISVSYSFALEDWIGARELAQGATPERRRVGDRDGWLARLADGSNLAAVSDGETLFTLSIAPAAGRPAEAADLEALLAACRFSAAASQAPAAAAGSR